MFKKNIQPTLYTIFAVLYLCIGGVLGGKQLLTLPVHVLYIVLTLYYLWRCFTDCFLNKAMKAIATVFFLHLLYGLVLYIVGIDAFWKYQQVTSKGFIIKYFRSMSPIFVYYFFSEKGYLSKKWFIYAAFVFLAVAFIQHQFSQASLSLKYGKDIGEFTDNSGYVFLAVLPIIVFLKEKPLAMYVLMVFLSVMMLTCAKRGAILVGVIVDIYLIYNVTKTSKHKIWMFFLSVILIAGLWYFVKYYIANNMYFASRLDSTLEGKSSGRDVIYSYFWNYFTKNNSVIGFLIGNGAYATLRLYGRAAHNDWLEIGMSMGVLGVIFYIRYWYYQIRTCIIAKKNGVDSDILIALTSVILIHLLKTFFSMSLDDMMIYSTSVLGFCLSQCNRCNSNQIQ